jgi:hypothetical protein
MANVVFKVLFVVFAALTIALVALIRIEEEAAPSDAEAAALRWVSVGVAEKPRRDGDNWEVDIVRPDGSMVQVTLGPRLELLDLDEEFGPAGTPASDEVRGADRARAVGAAFAEIGHGRVVSVERDSGREIDVGIRLSEGHQVEVQLDHTFRVTAVKQEHPSDE